MYSINKYTFKEFKITPGHRANYAILCNPELKENQWGIKYHPSNDYSREYKILALFSHPQIPVRYKVGRDTMYKDDKFVLAQHYLIMTHFEGEGVLEYYKKRDMTDRKEIEGVIQHFAGVTLPLMHMHAKGYLHSDIKPGHLILNPTTGVMALIDLECTIKTGETLLGMSREYASPEQKEMIQLLRKNEGEKDVLKKIKIAATSDLYSVGLILYEALTNKLWQENPVPPRELNSSIPEKLHNVILGLLEENPLNRIHSAELLKNELEAVV
ncbi:hypothetical protein [Candidatus Kuenenia sp.]|uniref:serine/threonine protein kinase n=1 Tax=Candidatus Kuenenia sp. TaxID=2499824 RepID=UPI00321FFE3B